MTNCSVKARHARSVASNRSDVGHALRFAMVWGSTTSLSASPGVPSNTATRRRHSSSNRRSTALRAASCAAVSSRNASGASRSRCSSTALVEAGGDVMDPAYRWCV